MRTAPRLRGAVFDPKSVRIAAQISRPERLVYELVRDGLDANARSLAANFATLAAVSEGRLT
ncbi:hypothetical protein, partial [Rhizobium leguminosarum]|uniref:hypothetical protein n=1 Tax=Rhizobium leguminosarum TaxID=384 RepID=UPI003F961E77